MSSNTSHDGKSRASQSDDEPLLETSDFDSPDAQWQRPLPHKHKQSLVSQLRQPLTWIPLLLSTILAFFLVMLLNQRSNLQARIQELGTNTSTTSSSASSPAASTLAHSLKSFYSPLIPVDAPSFVTAGNNATLFIAENVTWHEPLANQVLILDIDTRPLNASNQILHDGRVEWDTFDGLSSGMLNHYSYALIHNYDYRFIRIPSFTDRAPSWAKPSILSSLFDTTSYRFIVFLDNDCIFHHPRLPIEWLFNRWNITDKTSLSMPVDPYHLKNLDPYGEINLNTGFIIAQRSQRTMDILKAWDDCPNPGSAFPNCSRWLNNWSHEQAAFSEYIRYAFNEYDDVKSLPCTEANGYPESLGPCTGLLVRHYWIFKELLHDGVAQTFMNIAMERLRNVFLDNMGSLVVEWPGFQG